MVKCYDVVNIGLNHIVKVKKELHSLEREIISLSIGRPNLFVWKGITHNSAIMKKTISEAYLTKNGFSGDSVANRDVHGGPDRAVCLYPYEHYEQWERELNKDIKRPAFGENINVKNMLEKDVYIGDTFSLGEAIVQVSQGRIPCSTINRHNRDDRLLSRIVETGFTGYLFRVIQEGHVSEDSMFRLIERTQSNFSILKGNQLLFHDRKNKNEIADFLQVKELADVWKIKLESILKNN